MIRPIMQATLLLATLALPALAQRGSDFSWEGRVPAGRWLYIRNLNGGIRVERASGDRVEVRAEKRIRRGDPEDVRIEMRNLSNDDVIICAFWTENATCDEDGYRSRGNNWRRGVEISVEFTVRLPDGVKLAASSVNGTVRIDGVTAEVDAQTVNGAIIASSTGGPVRASTVNGDVEVRMREIGTRDLDFETVNGSVRVWLPDPLNAELDMRTVNGRVNSDFPLTLSGRINPRNIRATVGRGGPRIKLATTNGSVDVRKN